MDVRIEALYEELRQTEKEIEHSLQDRENNSWLTPILKKELADIRSTLQRVENGSFGKCELSGELIPEEILEIIPTLKSVFDYQSLSSFYKKPLYPSS